MKMASASLRTARWDRARVIRLVLRYMPYVVLAMAALIATWHVRTYW
jgi:L-cystine uptake protein TcyP (sodium:dicarboxylate symporter family)